MSEDFFLGINKNAVCENCGAKGKAQYFVTEDNDHGITKGYMICLECGAKVGAKKPR